MRRLIEKFPEVAKVRKEKKIYSSEVILSLGLISFIVFDGEKEKIQEIVLEELICSGAKDMSGIIIISQIICYLA